MSARPDDRAPMIVLSGYARVGKDSIAEAADIIDGGWQRHAIVDVLNEITLRTNPRLPSGRRVAEVIGDMGWVQAKDEIPGVRDYLDSLGQACRDAFGALSLGEAVLRRVSGPAFITGIRFPDEADVFRRAGAMMVRVERPGFGPACLDDGTPRASEIAMDDYQFDATVVNRRTPFTTAQTLLDEYHRWQQRPYRSFGTIRVDRSLFTGYG